MINSKELLLVHWLLVPDTFPHINLFSSTSCCSWELWTRIVHWPTQGPCHWQRIKFSKIWKICHWQIFQNMKGKFSSSGFCLCVYWQKSLKIPTPVNSEISRKWMERYQDCHWMQNIFENIGRNFFGKYKQNFFMFKICKFLMLPLNKKRAFLCWNSFQSCHWIQIELFYVKIH